MMAWGEPELDWDIDLESALAAYLASGNCTRSRCRCLRKPLLGRISRGNLKRHGISEMV
jgi:hypothetical protein